MLRGSRPWRERTRQVQEFLYPESLMSPSGRLCLLTILSLILPSRGQKLEESTPALAVHPATPVPGEDKGTDVTDSEFQTISTLQTWTRAADGLQTSQSQREAETETQQPTIMDTTFPATEPETHSETHTASKEGSTAPPRIVRPRIGPPVTREDIWQKFLTYKPRDWKKDSPFYYDTHTLRMRGLLVAAVLFITGIIILTSGKCRHLYGICRNHNRAYNVVNTRNLQKEEVPGGSQP